MDESGLSYRISPRKSYLSPSEDPRHACETEFQRHKAMIIIVLFVNAYGSHSIPVRSIGHAAGPRCFRDNHFDGYKEN